jgi:hypothetical protein
LYRGRMNGTLARVVVVAKAVPTYLVAASLLISIATSEIAQELDGDAKQNVVRWGGKAVAWIGAAVAIIRRSTPVIKAQRGLLEPDGGIVIPASNVGAGPQKG